MSSQIRIAFVVAGLALAFAAPAAAGIADSALPELLPGASTFHLYSVPGVIRISGLETFFSCTSLEKTATMQVGVELFAGVGIPFNDATGTSLSLGPGRTVLFGTGLAAWTPINSNLGFSDNIGSARILATSKKLACTAFVADAFNAPPTTSWQLTIIAKTKQKASN